jgi:signal transduction histidine kinase
MARWGVAAFLLLTLLLASLYLIGSVRDASRWIHHTDEARIALVTLEGVVLDAETGARGFAASGSPVFLEPYARSLARRAAALEAVRSLTADSPSQQRRIEELEPAIDHEYGVLLALIDAHKSGLAGEALVPLLSAGKEAMDNVRQRFADLLGAEDQLDVLRIRSETRKCSVAIAVDSAAVGLLIGGAAWFAKVRRLEQRAQREREGMLERERQAREEAEQASKFAELFLAVLGHDLRNPLSAIKLAGATLDRDAHDEHGRRTARRILSSSDRMADMIDQIMDFSRIRVGHGLSYEHVPTDLGDVVRRVGEELRGGSSIRIEVEGDTHGLWDPDRLAQVFSNLLGNALEHSPHEAVVFVKLDGRASDHVDVSVQNPGVIPILVMPQLFEPFRKGRPEEKSKGLGLGLFISREIVAAHGGTIGVSSSEREGTRFRVRLPRCVSPTNGARKVD